MSGVVKTIALASLLVLVMLAGSSQASLYSPDDPKIALQVGTDGKVQPMELDQLLNRLASYTNALDRKKLNDGSFNSDRQLFLTQIEKSKSIRNQSVDEKAALAGYLLRVGESDQAIALIHPLDRQPNYFVFQTLSHLYADSGDWKEAIRYHQEGQFDTEMPPTIKGLSAAQRDWWKKLDTDYLPLYYQLHKRDADVRKGLSQSELDKQLEMEEVLPLFPLPNSKTPNIPIRFVNDSGVYQPGQLAAAERAKLPDDAVAIVQQLLLWFPRDARLYWLLAELYASSNHFKNAATLFDRCAGPLQFSRRKIMMEHRAAVRAVADKDKSGVDLPLTQIGPVDPVTDKPPVDSPISMKTVWYYFGAIGLVAVFAIVRAILRQSKQKNNATT